MESTKIQQRRQCRRIDIVRMFFSLANSINTKGRDFFFQAINGGTQYSFRIGENICTYSVQKGGAL